jgi:NSS family neurotransmitter:Na+ symporter
MKQEQDRLIHGQWSSRAAFILAASGSAIGLGNIWKFPYLVGENGGGAFVLVYLLCVVAIGVPIMMAETLLGRKGRRSPVNTMRNLATEAGATKLWGHVGWLGVLAGFLILSYYSVIAGWSMAYIVKLSSGLMDQVNAEKARSLFLDLQGSAEMQFIWHTLFMLATLTIVSRGINRGLETATRYLMPLLFIMIVALDLYALGSEGAGAGLSFLFRPDFSRLSGESLMIALGQAFFSLGLGMGAIMMYGSYLPNGVSIARTSLIVAGADTLIALLAGVAIFPIVFTHHLAPGMGPGLIFETLPIAFGKMPGGHLFGTVFFMLVFFAAITSAIALIEPAVAWLYENRGMSREAATLWSGVACWFVGLGTIQSFAHPTDWHFAGKSFFEWLDFLTADLMLPIGGILIAVFAGWVLQPANTAQELALGPRYPLWYNAIRYGAPVAVGLILLRGAGGL